VGIGTVSPSYKLDILGDVRIQGGGSVSYAVLNMLDNTSGGSNWAIFSGYPAIGDFTIRESGIANHLIIKKSTGAATFSGSVSASSLSAGTLSINTNTNTERINVNGAVGFQNTSSVQKFHIQYFNGGLTFTESGVADYRIFIKDGGKIGFNTNNPFNSYTFKTGSGNNLDIFDTGSAFGIGMQAVNDANTVYKSWDFYASKFQFLQGNFLIGTTTDAGYKLQVNGSIAVTGSGYVLNPVPMIIGQYTSTVGYIQVPNQGSFEVWNGGTSAIAEFKNNSDSIFNGRAAVGTSLSGINTPSKLTIKANITDGNQIYIVQSNDDRGWKMSAKTDGHFYLQSAYTSGVTNVMRAFFDTSNVIFTASVTATSFFESSDATIKTLITDNYQAKGIESVVAKLYTKNGKEELGYYAQDVQGILPSAVSKGEDGLLSLSYREVHTAKISALEKRVAELEQQLNLN
jgi:hypothetical protein